MKLLQVAACAALATLASCKRHQIIPCTPGNICKVLNDSDMTDAKHAGEILQNSTRLVGDGMKMVDNDGGSCPTKTREEIFSSFSDSLYDFRSADRVKLSEGTVEIPLYADRRKFSFRRRKFKSIVVDGYTGVVKLRNKLAKKDLELNVLKHNFNGGWFFIQRTGDQSYLTWQYGNHREEADGFMPHTAYVLTFVYLSDDVSGCPSDMGSTFQVVILIGTRNRSRIVYNYAELHTLDSTPEIGVHDVTDGTTTDLEINDSAISSINELDRSTMMLQNMAKDGTIEYVSKAPLVTGGGPDPRTCAATEHCYCDNIQTEQDNVKFYHPLTGAVLDTVGLIEEHYEFSGFCSRTDTERNHAGYGWRGHHCKVWAKSAQCSGGGIDNRIFMSDVDIQGTSHSVEIPYFICVNPKGNPNNAPYWQRIYSTSEKDLHRDYKEAAGGRKKRSTARRNKINAQKAEANAEAEAARAACVMDEETGALNCDKTQKFTVLKEKSDVNVGCRYTCQHPEDWSDVDSVSFRPFENVDFKRNGQWICTHPEIDNSGSSSDVSVNPGSGVLNGGSCYLHCPGTGDADTPSITCDQWDERTGHWQYNRAELRALAIQFSETRWDCA